MSSNATISAPQFTHVPFDFFGVIGEGAIRRLVSEPSKPQRRAQVKHLATLAEVAGLASGVGDVDAVSFTVLKDGTCRVGYMKTLNTNPWATIDAQASEIKNLQGVITAGKAANYQQYEALVEAQRRLYDIREAVKGPFGDIVNPEDYAVAAVQTIVNGADISTVAGYRIWGFFEEETPLYFYERDQKPMELCEEITPEWLIRQSAQVKLLHVEIQGYKSEISGLRNKVLEVNYEDLAEAYIQETVNSTEMDENQRALVVAAVRDFAESLSK